MAGSSHLSSFSPPSAASPSSSSSPSPPDVSVPGAASASSNPPAIAFFDVETSIPSRTGQGYALLEFGAILVCPRRLVELGSYSTLVRPRDLSVISPASVRCNGITSETIAAAPALEQVADRIYDILHGNVWAGHNILRFDCLRIREAFEEIGHAVPQPVSVIDSLPLLTHRFGRRAGDMKMATLANYFGIGRQKHRSLDDVRMNIEVLKHCATILFLESCFPECPTMDSSVSPNTAARSCSRAILSGQIRQGAADLTPLVEQMKLDTSTYILQDVKHTSDMPQEFYDSRAFDRSNHHDEFSSPEEVSLSCVTAPVVPSTQGGDKIMVLHQNSPLQLCCTGLKVHYGISKRFLDYAGRPKLSVLVAAPPKLCLLLDACDNLAQRSSSELDGDSEWRPVIRKSSISDSFHIRLHIPTVTNGEVASYSTEIYQKEPSGNIQKLVFSKVEVAELEPLFTPGTFLDVFFCMDIYKYQQHAGMRLVAKKIIVHPR